MSDEHESPDTGQAADGVVARVKLYAGAAITVVSLVGMLTTAAVKYVTGPVHREVVAARTELHKYVQEQKDRQAVDSLRFERVMYVVELAVVALIEPEGSTDQRRAVMDLRSLRRVTPRR